MSVDDPGSEQLEAARAGLNRLVEQLWELARARVVEGRRDEARDLLRRRQVAVERLELLLAEPLVRRARAVEDAVEGALARLERDVAGPLRGN